MAGSPRAVECKGRHGSGEAAAGAEGPLHGASTGAPFGQSVRGAMPRAPTGICGALIVNYLATNPAFEGIGIARASRLWEEMGEDLYRALGSADVSALAAVVGLDRAEALARSWACNLAEGDVVVWLSERGFDPRLGIKAVRFWGADALGYLKENPYVLMALAPWPRVDAAARALGFSTNHPHRQIAAVEAVLYRRLGRGHTWTAAAEVETEVGKLLSVGLGAARGAVGLALQDRAAIEIKGGYQPVGAHVMERFVADRIFAMTHPTGTDDLLAGRRAGAIAAGRELGEVPGQGAIILNEAQRAAVAMALEAPVGLILGGAGVGKTTVLAAVHRAAERSGLTVIQMALAGRAAMRMREATSRPASTIAGFLRACGKGELRPGPDCIVVVDEASMLDLPLLYSILRHLGDGCRLLMVGDPNQLPPISFGLTFHLFAADPALPKVELVQVHRQAAETGIPAIADAVCQGDIPAIPPWVSGLRRGVSFLECRPLEAVDAVTDLLAELGGAGGETQVLSAVRSGPAGVQAINLHLHRLRSAGKPTVGLRSLAVGDPLLFTRNDYRRELYNGSLGEMLAFDDWGNMTVVFDGRRIVLTAADLGDIDLAYCLTVHKAQGSQFRRVIVPVFPSRVLDRTLLYTAMTRATEQVVFVGDREAFEAAVSARPSSALRQTAMEAIESGRFQRDSSR